MNKLTMCLLAVIAIQFWLMWMSFEHHNKLNDEIERLGGKRIEPGDKK